jgi:hypothetical protein
MPAGWNGKVVNGLGHGIDGPVGPQMTVGNATTGRRSMTFQASCHCGLEA